jgi:FkbM family methyltransferase
MPDVLDFLPVGGVGVDIGAEPDKDDWTGRMLQRVGETGKVYAFEPDPAKFVVLYAMYGGRSNVVLEQKAVADRSGPLTMVRQGSHYSLAYLGGSDLTVEAVTLDDYFAAVPMIHVLKIDTEGGEYRILQGARQVIQRNPQMIIALELHRTALAVSGVSIHDFVALLDELDLSIGHWHGEPVTEDELTASIEGQQFVVWRKA